MGKIRRRTGYGPQDYAGGFRYAPANDPKFMEQGVLAGSEKSPLRAALIEEMRRYAYDEDKILDGPLDAGAE